MTLWPVKEGATIAEQVLLEEVFKKEKVTMDRSYAVDSAIIKIMKTRKRLEISSLQ